MAYKLKENVPTVMTFPYGDFEEKDGDYGPQWMYKVDVDGQKEYLYANEKLHKALQAANVAKGSVLTVTLGKEGRSNVYTVTGGGSAAPSSNSRPNPAAPAPRPAGGLTFADISFAYRECLFAASAHLVELASLHAGETPRLVDFAVIQSAAATMMIQADRAGCLPRAPKAAPKLDGEHTKAFLSWLGEYRARPDVAALWTGGKNEIAAFIVGAASQPNMTAVAESNDPVMYEHVKTMILAETANRAEAAKGQPMEEGQAELPF
jgi:hypothetical protein